MSECLTRGYDDCEECDRQCAGLYAEIAAERAKVAKLRAALEAVKATDDHADPEVRATVRAALEETKP